MWVSVRTGKNIKLRLDLGNDGKCCYMTKSGEVRALHGTTTTSTQMIKFFSLVHKIKAFLRFLNL